MNIFEYIANYHKQNVPQQYGDIGNDNVDIIEQSLDSNSLNTYRNIKQSDINRLINESSISNNNKYITSHTTSVPGIYGFVRRQC